MLRVEKSTVLILPLYTLLSGFYKFRQTPGTFSETVPPGLSVVARGPVPTQLIETLYGSVVTYCRRQFRQTPGTFDLRLRLEYWTGGAGLIYMSLMCFRRVQSDVQPWHAETYMWGSV